MHKIQIQGNKPIHNLTHNTSGHSATLANSIIGVGILAMPFCFTQCGIFLSILLLLLSGIISRSACHLLLRSSVICKRRNFEVLAYHVFGAPGKFAVDVGIIGFMMGTCVAYFVVVGDLGPQIIAKMLNMNHSSNLRTGVMIIVSIVCVLPLGLLKDLDSFSNVSAATLGFYFCLIFKIVAEAIDQIISGEWVNQVTFWRPEGILQCLPIFSMALCCQTQLFEIYETLPGASLDKMNSITKSAVNICTMVYILVGFFGYVAFSKQNISGNILMNFSPSMASDVIKVGFVLSIAFSFPLIIFPCRSSLHSLLYKKGQVSLHDFLGTMSIPEKRFRCLTIFIITVSLIVGLLLPNIELVLGFVGSTIGILICVIFPAACFICLSIRNTNERILAQVLLIVGILIMVLGTYANLQAAEMDNIALENLKDENNVIQSPDIPKLLPNEEMKLKQIEDEVKKEPEPVKEEIVVEKINIKKAEIPVLISSSKTNDSISKTIDIVELKIETQKSNDAKKIEDIKNQELIETMKKHEEEQRKLVEEQKEILQKMEEMKKDDSLKINSEDDQKKAAVESIQKLAKIAIESLGGDPDQVDSKESNPKNVEKEIEDILKEEKKIEGILKDDKPAENVIKEEKPLENVLKPLENIIKDEKQAENVNQIDLPIEESKSSINATEKILAGGKRDLLEKRL